MNNIKFYISDDHTLKGAVEGFASAYGNGANMVTMVAPFLTTHTMYVLYRKPNGIEAERYVMIPTGATEIVDVAGNDEEWNVWINVLPGAVVNIDSAVAQDLAVGFEDWFFVPEDGFLGIVQFEADLTTTFPLAVEGDFARVVDTNTDWQFLSSVWVDSETQLVGQESRERVEMVDVTVDPNINGGLPTVAPDNTEIIITILNNKLSISDAIATYVARDLETAYSAASSVELTDKIHIQTATGSKYATASQIQAGAGGMAISDYDTEGTATNSVKFARNVGIDGNSVAYTTVLTKLSYIDQDVKTTSSPTFVTPTVTTIEIGDTTLSYSTTNRVATFDYGNGVMLQVGEESYVFAVNKEGTDMVEGQPASITGATGSTPQFVEASTSDDDLSHKTVGILTEDIDNNAKGKITTFGLVRDIDTTGTDEGETWVEGDFLYVGDGALTNVEPTKPLPKVEIGLVLVSNASVGVIFVNVDKAHKLGYLSDVDTEGSATGDILQKNSSEVWKYINPETILLSRDVQNGAIKETFDFRYNASTSLMELTAEVGNNLTQQFSDGDTDLDVTTAVTAEPTFGSTTVPVINYFSIRKIVKGVVLKSTSGWPTDEHIKIAECVFLDEVKTDSDGGALRNQNINNHEKNGDDIGMNQHVRARLRAIGAQWDSGVGGATSGSWVFDDGGTLYWTSSAGLVWQMHKQTFDAKLTQVNDDMHVKNDFTAPYKEITSFDEITAYSGGGAISNNTHFSVIVWGSINKTGEYDSVFVNLPSGGYVSLANALEDAQGFVDSTVPTIFRDTAFQIAKLTFKLLAGTYTLEDEQDLRDVRFGVSGTTGGTGLDDEFTDNLFRVQNITDATKEHAYDVSGVTTGTTRTTKVADVDVDVQVDILTPIADLESGKVDKDNSGYTPIAASSVADADLARVALDDDGASKSITLNEIYAGANTATGSFVSSTDYASNGLGAYKSAMLTYHDLTLDTNGDYKVDIKTQITDQIVYVLFPTITSNTNDLRISTDDGVTYYDVLINGGNVYAELVSDKLLQVKFDGSNFIVDLTSLSQQLTFDSGVNSTFGVVSAIKGSPQVNQINGLLLNQANINGNYVDNSTNLSIFSATLVATSNILIATGTTGTTISLFQATGLSTSGLTEIYIKGRARIRDSGASNLRLAALSSDGTGGGFEYLDTIVSPVVDQWYEFEKVVDVSSYTNNLDLRFTVGYADVGSKVLEIDGLYATTAIPITNTPLASKTASELNGIITSYFEGIDYITDFELQSRGLNLIDKVNFKDDIKLNTDGSYITSGESQLGVVERIAVIGGEQYTFSGISGLVGIFMWEYDASDNPIQSQTQASDVSETTFTLDDNTAYIRFRQSSALTGDFETIKNALQLEEGTTATDYQAYNSPQDNFTVITDLLSVGTVRDIAYPLNGAWWKDQYNKEYDLVDADFNSYNTTAVNVDVVLLNKFADWTELGVNNNLATTQSIIFPNYTNGLFADATASIGIVYSVNSTLFGLIVAKGEYADIAAAKLDLIGTTTYYNLADIVTTEIEKNGSLIQESNTTIVQLNNFATEYLITFALDDVAQRELDTAKLIYLQGEVDDIEIKDTAQDVRMTDIEDDISTLIGKAIYYNPTGLLAETDDTEGAATTRSFSITVPAGTTHLEILYGGADPSNIKSNFKPLIEGTSTTSQILDLRRSTFNVTYGENFYGATFSYISTTEFKLWDSVQVVNAVPGVSTGGSAIRIFEIIARTLQLLEI